MRLLLIEMYLHARGVLTAGALTFAVATCMNKLHYLLSHGAFANMTSSTALCCLPATPPAVFFSAAWSIGRMWRPPHETLAESIARVAIL